ncbi:MAG: dynamin family protein [Mycobacteriales bacterium]
MDLCGSVAQLAAAIRPQLSPPVADRVEDVAGRLGGPLQLAVAGRIKSGKSTVVNALIGRRVSPTDIRECTRMVTRFRYGTVDRVEIVGTKGQRKTIPYDDEGLVPAELGVPTDQVAYVDAYLTSEALRDMTVIDTPGLGSLDEQSAQRTTDLLGGGVTSARPGHVPGGGPGRPGRGGTGRDDPGLDRGSSEAIARAEAVLFVLTQAARADDFETLSIFHAHATPRSSNPINALALLNKADQIVAADDPGSDPWPAARELAKAQSAALRHRVSDVVPLIGLIAETARTGLFTETDAAALRAIAELDEDERMMLFYSADFFINADVDVDARVRGRLIERLDLFGIRYAVEQLVAGPDVSAGELRRRLDAMCGFPEVREVVDRAFRRQADGIKANFALATLESICAGAPPADRACIRDALEKLMQRPEAHQLRMLEAASIVGTGIVALPPEFTEDLAALIGHDTPSEQLGRPGAPMETLRQIALDKAGRWRSFATFGSTPAQSRVAHVVHRGYFLLYQQLSPGRTR